MSSKLCSKILLISLLACGFAPANQSRAAGGIHLKQDIVSVRVVVVDQNQNILEIWNQVQPQAEYFELQIHGENREGGAEEETPAIVNAYQQLLPYLDVKAQGLIYNKKGVEPVVKLNDVVFILQPASLSQEIYTHT